MINPWRRNILDIFRNRLIAAVNAHDSQDRGHSRVSIRGKVPGNPECPHFVQKVDHRHLWVQRARRPDFGTPPLT